MLPCVCVCIYDVVSQCDVIVLVVWCGCSPVTPCHFESFLEWHVNQLTCNIMCLYLLLKE